MTRSPDTDHALAPDEHGTDPVAARPRLGVVLALLALAQLIFSLDINIVFVALPDIGDDLGFTTQSLQWVVGAYAVFSGGFLMLGGRAADLLGRRAVFITALCLYGVSSLAGGLAPSSGAIIAARAVQGVGGALLLPSTLALIGSLFAEGRERNRALAVWGGAGASGLTLGALLGGVLTQAFGWPAVFFVNVPLGAVVVLGAVRFIPADVRATSRRRFDLPGAVTGTATALLLVYGLVQGPISGWASPLVVTAFALAVVAAVAFALIERTSSDPLLPGNLLRQRTLFAGASITFVYMGTFGALPYFLTMLFQKVHGLSALQTGLLFLVPSAAIAAGTQFGERLATRHSARTALTIGFAIGIPGTALLALAFHADSGLLVATPGLIVSGIGQGIVWTGMWVAAATGVRAEQQGVANSIASTSLSLGNAIGIAALTAVATSHAGGLAGAAGTAHGGLIAVLAAAAIMLIGSLAILVLPSAGRSDVTNETGECTLSVSNTATR